MSDAQQDKLFITEIINDLYRNGFVSDGKASEMLRDWAVELRREARTSHPASRLKRVHAKLCGANNW